MGLLVSGKNSTAKWGNAYSVSGSDGTVPSRKLSGVWVVKNKNVYC